MESLSTETVFHSRSRGVGELLIDWASDMKRRRASSVSVLTMAGLRSWVSGNASLESLLKSVRDKSGPETV